MLAADLDGNDQADLVADFGVGSDVFGSSTGIWALINGSHRFQITPKSAASATAVNIDGGRKDKIVLHFSGVGIAQYTHSTPVGVNLNDYVLSDWALLSPKAANKMIAADLNANGKQEFVVDFGSGSSNGLWKYSAGAWSQISTQTTSGLVSGQFK